jgi:hypothetical protein
MQLAVMRVIGLKKNYEKSGGNKFEPNVVSLFSHMGRRNTVVPASTNPQEVKFSNLESQDPWNDPQLTKVEGREEHE